MKYPYPLLFSFFFFAHYAQSPSPQSLKELAQEYCELAHHIKATNKKKAIEYYTKAISFDQNNAIAHAQLGCLYYEENNIPSAIDHFTQSLIHHPHDPHLHFNLGQCHIRQQQWGVAAKEFQLTIAIDPRHEHAYFQLGCVQEKRQMYQEAIEAYQQAINLNTSYFEAHYALGNLFKHLEQLEECLPFYRKAHTLQPHHMQLSMDLANVLHMLNYHEESLALYQQIVEHHPNAVSALYNFGFTLKKMGHLERAMAVYHQVLAKNPTHAPTHFSLSSIYLTLGDFERGWQEYEWRWKAYNETPKTFTKPTWNSQDLTDKTLFVHAEQGLGDTLQFIRYLKLLKKKYPTVQIILQSQDPLITLFTHQPYIDHVISRQGLPRHFDYHIALMSLPYVLQTRLETIPCDIPYITLPQQLVDIWQRKLSADTNFKIGICWQGNARYNTQALRRAVALKSIQLNQFAPLFTIPGVSIYSLQQVDGTDQIDHCPFKDRLITFDTTFDQQHGRFMDTAAVMQQLDLVISVDTGICHLAGALNIPTWILLPEPADWRWLLDRIDSPWYPSVRLFRQTKNQDWDSVLQRIADELAMIVPNKKSPLIPVTPIKTFSQAPSNDQRFFFESLINTLALENTP